MLDYAWLVFGIGAGLIALFLCVGAFFIVMLGVFKTCVQKRCVQTTSCPFTPTLTHSS